jgi:Raf kinase inhibitor-like YbhB/YbcL family protein
MTPRTRIALTLAAAAFAVGCSSSKHAAGPSTPMKLTSPAFAEGQLIPIQFTCAGSNVSPPLAWSAPPAGTAEQALVMEDLDASYVHWVMSGIKSSIHSLAATEIPSNAVVSEGTNGTATYFGPCPPQGKVHHYRITLYALSSHVPVSKASTAADAVSQFLSHSTGQAMLTGQFAR